MDSFRNNSTQVTSLFLLLIQFLFFLLICITQFPLACQGCHEQERMVLLDFKLSLRDPSNRLSSWQEGNQHGNCCRWHGIECSHDSFHVTSINLRNKELEIYFQEDLPGVLPPNTTLQGKLSPSLSNITQLEYLDLSFNNFLGVIPKSICKMSSLRKFDIGNNNLTGRIPSCLTKLQNLTVFRVSQNFIKGNVSLITYINKLNLTDLDLSSNRLTVVVDQRVHLYSKFKLEYLALQSCNLEGLFPTFICKLSNLKSLDLSHNHLTGDIPSCLHKLKSPYSFILSSNKLSGSIPLSICSKDSRSNLQVVDMSDNRLSGIIPASIGYCRNLTFLHLGNNSLTGEVPKELEQVKSLKFLQLHDNYLNGTISISFFRNLPNLEILHLANNHFQGSIPSEFGTPTVLKFLSLRSNKFNGSIPDEINHAQELRIIDLSHNILTGIIPRQIGKPGMKTKHNFTGLSRYDLKYVKLLKGILIPFENLYGRNPAIDLSCNVLEGNIPEEISLLKDLSFLNLSHNILSGMIPQGIGSIKYLEALDFSFNKLSGNIPESIASMDHLVFFNLSYNNLSGRIPKGGPFDKFIGDNSAFIENRLLYGEMNDQINRTGGTNLTDNAEEGEQEEANARIMLYGIIALGFGTGFFGLFLVLLLRKDILWFLYWRFVDSVAIKIIGWWFPYWRFVGNEIKNVIRSIKSK